MDIGSHNGIVFAFIFEIRGRISRSIQQLGGSAIRPGLLLGMLQTKKTTCAHVKTGAWLHL